MPSGGHNRKPTQLKVIQGTARPDRTNPREPKALEGAVKPPAWLSANARRYWRQILPLLIELRVVSRSDQQSLALLSDALAEYVAAREVVETEGMSYETEGKNGRMVRQRPEVAIASDAWRRAAMMLQQFGMTAASRAKVNASDVDELDPFEEFLRDGRDAG